METIYTLYVTTANGITDYAHNVTSWNVTESGALVIDITIHGKNVPGAVIYNIHQWSDVTAQVTE